MELSFNTLMAFSARQEEKVAGAMGAHRRERQRIVTGFQVGHSTAGLGSTESRVEP